jgi:hypothetical protein
MVVLQPRARPARYRRKGNGSTTATKKLVDSSSGKSFTTINPHDEAVRQWTIRINFDRANKNETLFLSLFPASRIDQSEPSGCKFYINSYFIIYVIF